MSANSSAARMLMLIGAALAVVFLAAAWATHACSAPRRHPESGEAAASCERPAVHSTGPNLPVPSSESELKRIQAAAALKTTRRARSARMRSQDAPMPRLLPSAAVGLIVVAGWLFVSPWLLGYPFSSAAEGAQLRQTGAAVVLAWCGLWLHQGGRRLVVSLVAAVVGGLVLLSAAWYHYAYAPIEVNGMVSGGAAISFALLTMVRQRTRS